MEPNWNELELIFQELYDKKYLERSDKILTLIQDLDFNYNQALIICKSMDIRDYSSIILMAYLKRALKKSGLKQYKSENKYDLFDLIKMSKLLIN